MPHAFREFDWDEISRKDTFMQSKKIEKQNQLEAIKHDIVYYKENIKIQENLSNNAKQHWLKYEKECIAEKKYLQKEIDKLQKQLAKLKSKG